MKKPVIATFAALGALLAIWAIVFLPSRGEERAPEPASSAANEPARAEPSGSSSAGNVADPSQPVPAAPSEPERAAAEPAPPQQQPRPEKMGPVDELKSAYASDPRDGEAGAMEQRIRSELERQAVPAELLRRVSCVKTVCKLELSWSARDAQAYMIAMMHLVGHFSQKLAAEPVGEHDGDDEAYPVDVYVSRVEPAYLPATPK